MSTPIGQASWEFYKLWLTKQNRKPRGIDTFSTSYFYNAFIKFAKFVKQTHLPEVETFIKFAILKKYDPNLWDNKSVYQEYLEFLDRQGDPLQRTATTIRFIQKYTDENGCEFKEVFNHITTPEIVHKIYSREISPWLILNSSKFWDFYENKVTSVDRIQLDGVIRIEFWKERFSKHPKAINDIKNIVKRLNL